jgi:hypothetical protein
MGYQVKFEDILLDGWEGWDGNGISSIPAKNVTFVDGSTGCILIDNDGVSLYDCQAEQLNVENDEGNAFVDYADSPKDLHEYLPHELIQECETVLTKFKKRELSFE